MSTSAPVDDPAGGQFHGEVRGYRPLESAVMLKTVPTGEALPSKTMHRHERAYFWMLLHGDCEERVEGGIERSYEPFQLTFHPQGEAHAHWQGESPPTGFGVILSDEAFANAKEFLPVRNDPRTLDRPVFSKLAHRIVMEFHVRDSASNLALESLCLDLVCQASNQALTDERKAPNWLSEAKDYLHDCPASNVRLSEIASLVGIHPVHLGHEFHRFYGCTPGEYQRHLRLARARRLLLQPGPTIAEIAAESGFYDEAHFCRTFRSFTGQSPTEFRAKGVG